MLRGGGLAKVAKSTSRRQFLQGSASAALVAGMAPAVIPSRARAQQKTLKILQWKHFVPSYDAWFDDNYVKEWGERIATRVIYNVGLGGIGARAAAETEARQGHDLVMLLAAPALYEDQLIDHREIYEECEHRYGAAGDFAIQSTYNPKTTSTSVSAAPSGAPDLPQRLLGRDGRHVRQLGRHPPRRSQIKLLHGSPVGISLAPKRA
jgi:hypothetical protein